MKSPSEFFLTPDPADREAFRRMMAATVRAIDEAMAAPGAFSGISPEALKKLVHTDTLLPEHGLGFDASLADAVRNIMPHLVRTASTDYMAHLHSPALLESVAAELILSAFNQSMDSWDQSPAATETELDVIRHLCELYGYGPESDGVFTSGGSQSNLSGLLLARDRFCNEKLNWDVRKHGLPENRGKLRIYTSEIAHFSVEKSAHLMGLGTGNTVKVPVDAAMKMDVAALRELIRADLAAGCRPFCVSATVGTTDFGSIDPLPELRTICDEFGLWLHADAAYGSGVVMSRKYASRVAGLGQCDSITVDFHKMFLLPISCSAALVRDGKSFDALTIHADYLNRVEDEEDGYTNLVDKSMQTTRRFDALKVRMAFLARGREGWSDIITSVIDNAAYLYDRLLASPDFEPAVRPEISSVVFRLLPRNGGESADDLNRQVRRTLLHRYGTVVGQTVCRGSVFLKFTLLNPRITHRKLDELLTLIVSLR